MKEGFRRIGTVSCTCLIYLITLAACAPGNDRAKDFIRISDCSNCELTVTRGPDIGAQAGSGMIASDEARAVRDSRGRYYLLPRIYGSEVSVFDSTGHYLQTIGREGAGPGEFSDIGKLLITPGDSLVVLDWAARRLTLFDPDHQLIRTVPLPLSPEIVAALTPDGGVVIGLLRPGEDSASANSLRPLHHVSPEGALLRSFGEAGEVYDATVPHSLSRTIATADGNAIWSAWRMPYRIDRYDLDSGELTTSLVRNTDFFPSLTDEQRRTSKLKPMPMVASVQQDSTGLLWVLLYLPDPAWESAVDRTAGSHGGKITDYDRYHDTRVEVIDPVRGALVGYRHFDEYLSHMVAAGIIAGVVVRDTAAVLQTWRLKVDR